MATFLTMDAFVWPKHLQKCGTLVGMVTKIFVPYVGSSIYLPMHDLTDNCFLAEIVCAEPIPMHGLSASASLCIASMKN